MRLREELADLFHDYCGARPERARELGEQVDRVLDQIRGPQPASRSTSCSLPK